MKNIVAWIEKEGLEGFLYFEDGELTLSKVDPKDQAESKRRARPVSLETETKKTG